MWMSQSALRWFVLPVLVCGNRRMTGCLRVPTPDTWCVCCWMGGLNGCVVGYCGRLWPSMPKRKEACASKNCGTRFSPSRKGCGGRQTVQPEYLQYAKVLLKDGAKVGDWICLTHRDQLKWHERHTELIWYVCHVQPHLSH